MTHQEPPKASPFEAFFRDLYSTLPPGMSVLQQDFEKNLRAAVQAGLARMELVTREEFDVQAALLSRTRAKLDALEARVAALEAAHPELARKPPPGQVHDYELVDPEAVK